MEKAMQNVFLLVERLALNRPFSTENIEKIFLSKIRHISGRSNEYFANYRTTEAIKRNGAEISLELKFPKKKSKCSDGLLILSIKTAECIKKSDIFKRFGEGEPIPPNPDMPIDKAELDIAYAYDWGRIVFGIKAYGDQCLNTIVFDAIK